jgi:hypothetical protein
MALAGIMLKKSFVYLRVTFEDRCCKKIQLAAKDHKVKHKEHQGKKGERHFKIPLEKKFWTLKSICL